MPKNKPGFGGNRKWGGGKEVALPAVGNPISTFGPTADLYFERADTLAVACSYAMAEGSIY